MVPRLLGVLPLGGEAVETAACGSVAYERRGTGMARQCPGRLAFFAEMSLELPGGSHRSGPPSARERRGLSPSGTPWVFPRNNARGHLASSSYRVPVELC